MDAASIADAALSLFTEHGYWGTTMADIGNAVGVRGPSLYRHVESKHQLLTQIMFQTMNDLLKAQKLAIASGFDHREKLYRAVYQHVRYHCLHRREAFVGNREIRSLEESFRDEFLELRLAYGQALRELIHAGCEAGVFTTSNEQLVTYAMLDMGIGAAAWFSEDGTFTVEEVSKYYAATALRMVSADADTEMPHLYWGPSTFIPA